MKTKALVLTSLFVFISTLFFLLYFYRYSIPPYIYFRLWAWNSSVDFYRTMPLNMPPHKLKYFRRAILENQLVLSYIENGQRPRALKELPIEWKDLINKAKELGAEKVLFGRQWFVFYGASNCAIEMLPIKDFL